MIGCGDMTPKDFLFKYPEVKFQINSKGEIYDKYTAADILSNMKCKNEIILFHIGDKKYELKMTGNLQRIGDTNFKVRYSSG
jgi:hypothetical protein